MPVALTNAMRQRIILEKEKGKSLISISQKHQLSYSTVCRIYQRYQREGEAGLQPRYANCGQRSPTTHQALIQRAALWLKRLHRGWGAGFILLQVEKRYGGKLPCERTLQRWFKHQGLDALKTTLPTPDRQGAQRAHDIWQIDAKEKIQLSNGERLCYLSVADQRSGGLLNAFVFPPLPYQ